MSKSTLKLKHFDIFNLTNYFQSLSDDIMQDEEDIIDIIYEASQDNKLIFTFLLLLSKGTLMYFEYNTVVKKISNLYTNTALSMITNELICAELSFNSPIIVATSLNELILVETTQKPCQMINVTEEGINICSEPCDSQIIDIKFNCNQSCILVVTANGLKVFRIGIDKIEGKSTLQFFTDINLIGIDKEIQFDYTKYYNKRVYCKFSDFIDNNMIISYITHKPIAEDYIKLSVDSDEIIDNNNNNNTNTNTNPNYPNNNTNVNDVLYLNVIRVNLAKKDYSMSLIQSYIVDNTFVKIEFSYFYEKLFVLFEGGVVCCINVDQINTGTFLDNNNMNNINNSNTNNNNYRELNTNSNNNNKNTNNINKTKDNNNNNNNFTNAYDDKLIFKYPLNSPNVKFTDIYVHPSSNFVVIRDSQSTFLIFDFTLNLYYIMHNSKISVKLNMNSFDKNEEVKFLKFKPYELNYFIKNSCTTNQWNVTNEFRLNKEMKSAIVKGKFINNSMFFVNSRSINGIFIEISSKFNQKNTLNSILDEFQLLKNHLRGQNFDSSFKIMTIISNFQQWIYSLFLITNKLCHHPQNILLIKRHSLAAVLRYLKDKSFNDEEKNNTFANIRNLCFTNIVLRCLSIRQYEYAYLIIDTLGMNHLLKLLSAHCKLTKFLGVNYLACSKLEIENENEDNIISELNRIINNTNFTLSQNNMQSLIKDIDELIENDKLNNDYLKDSNSLEINLQKYYEGLQMEMEGRFEEAKELYKQNGLNYDYMRVEKLNKELLNQISEDSILEFNDIKIDKEN